MFKKLCCRLLGHVWLLQPYEDAPNGWFFEHHKCQRCGARRRELVASKLG